MEGIVVIPTYNEHHNIAALIKHIFALKLKQSHTLKVVVIDDASPDGTAQIVKELIPHYPENLFLIERKNERGRGSAGLKGFLFCLEQQVDYIIEMDADFSHDPEYLTLFLELATYYDVIIGSRFVQGGQSIDRKIYRKVISAIANKIYRLVLGLRLQDISGGFKCYRKEVLMQLNFAKFYSKGYSIGLEMLYRIHLTKANFLEIPIYFKERQKGMSKFSFREIIEALCVTLKLCWHYRILNRIVASAGRKFYSR